MVAQKARTRVERRKKGKYITKYLKDESDESLSAGNEGEKLEVGRNEKELLPSPLFVSSGTVWVLSWQHFDNLFSLANVYYS